MVGDVGETKLGRQSDADAMEGKPTSVVIVRVVQDLLVVVCNGRRGKISDRWRLLWEDVCNIIVSCLVVLKFRVGCLAWGR